MRKYLTLLFILSVMNLEAQKITFYSVQKLDSSLHKSYTLYSKFGQRIISSECDWISTNYMGWIFCWKDKLIKVYDSTGKYLNIDKIQEIQQTWANTTLIPLKRKGYWGYYSNEGKLVIKHKYEDVTLFRNGKAAVKLKEKIYFIDTSGKILPEKYFLTNDYNFEKLSTAVGLTNFFNKPQETFKKDGKFGLIEKATGKVLLQAIYDGIFSISKENVIVQLGKKYGVMNFFGKIIIPIECDMIYLLD
jgi:hypothetical protein